MADLSNLRAQIRRRAEFAVSNASPQLQQTLRSTSPRVTGRMQNATSVTPAGLTATAKAATPYASFVRQGTRPHVIRARRKVLSFFWPRTGRRMFLPRVNHPGSKGNTWWDNGLKDWPRLLEAALRRAPNG
jgi:hypothetical protein